MPLKTFNSLKSVFATGKTLPYAWRIAQLRLLRKMISDNEDMIIDALTKDLGRSELEAVCADLLPCYPEIDLAINNLSQWMLPNYSSVPLVMAPASSEELARPLGVVLIIGPFNYPVQLCFTALVGAIAAGNCILVKPSETSIHCETVILKLIQQYLDQDCIRVITGDYKVSAELTKLPWNKIFFTGSTRVGKLISKAAAENLTPVTLELGGKSPVIIDSSITDMTLITKRIIWGKCYNSGQTCVGCDYVLVHASKYDEFVQACQDRIKEFYGENPKKSSDFGRIVNSAMTKRLKKLMQSAGNSATFLPPNISGPELVDENECYVPPTLITGVPMDSLLMKEEIFGPILPIIRISSIIDESIDIINTVERKQPLALYIFSKNSELIDNLMEKIPAGGVVVNDTLLSAASPHLPFGGVGPSGLGRYHGKATFECFSHIQSIIRRHDYWWLDIPARFPPYSPFKLNVFRLAFALPSQPALSNHFIRRSVWTSLFIAFMAYNGTSIIETLKVNFAEIVSKFF